MAPFGRHRLLTAHPEKGHRRPVLPSDIFTCIDLGGCQNYGPFLGTLNIRGRIIIGTQRGTIFRLPTIFVQVVKGSVLLGSVGMGVSQENLSMHIIYRQYFPYI